VGSNIAKAKYTGTVRYDRDHIGFVGQLVQDPIELRGMERRLPACTSVRSHQDCERDTSAQLESFRDTGREDEGILRPGLAFASSS
jgi:hypothetical protein